MTSFGLTLSSEENPPSRLVEIAQLAEDSGFDFVSISDHYHPWVDAQGHSPFVWSVLGAIAQQTKSLEVAVGVTCPIMRIHPAILAQAAATTADHRSLVPVRRCAYSRCAYSRATVPRSSGPRNDRVGGR